MNTKREAFFLNSLRGRRFCIATRPATAPLGAILYLPPFAEEMNKSRRMAALAAQAFAERGWLVLQPDLMGCGDSDGEFGEAGWRDWLDDVGLAWKWLASQALGLRALWTLRAGSLLAADWVRESGAEPAMLLWQPVLNGRQHLTQFLRLKAANEMLADADARAAISRVRAALDGGKCVEVAGYTLSPQLATGLEAATFGLPEGFAAELALLEMSSGDRLEPSPAIAVQGRLLVEAGLGVELQVVQGPAFWQTQEIELAPTLIECSLTVLARWGQQL